MVFSTALVEFFFFSKLKKKISTVLDMVFGHGVLDIAEIFTYLGKLKSLPSYYLSPLWYYFPDHLCYVIKWMTWGGEESEQFSYCMT